MNSFQVRILRSDGIFYEGPCESLTIPASDGMVGIWAGHANMISAVVTGTLSYRLPGEETEYAAVSEGMIKVEDGEVLLLCQTIERPEEIDERRVEARQARAREALLQKRSIREYRLAQLELARTANRLKVYRRYGMDQ